MPITVMTYNIRGGTYNPLGLEGIARLIDQYHPDVVGLQEINVNRHGTGPIDQPRWLADRLAMASAFGASISTSEKNLPDHVGFYGNGLLSRFPIFATDVFSLPRPHESVEQRSLLAASLDTPEGPLNIFVTHWGLDQPERQAQSESAIELVTKWRPDEPIVLVGDFNAGLESPEIARVCLVFHDAFDRCLTPGPRKQTFPSGVQGSVMPDGWSGVIDHIFVKAGIGVDRCEVVYDAGRASDHNPVLAVLHW